MSRKKSPGKSGQAGVPWSRKRTIMGVVPVAHQKTGGYGEAGGSNMWLRKANVSFNSLSGPFIYSLQPFHE
jgi:hypothetical protein